MSAQDPAPSPEPSARYDVLVLGGALSGTGFVTFLRQRLPDCRAVVVELSESFGRRVGEATVEVSGSFLCRLGLSDHLEAEHLPKHGLRYWFGDGEPRDLDEMTEVGGWEVPSLPSFQLDRSRVDEHLLEQVREEGCEVLRPAKVVEIEHGWPESRVRIETEDGKERVLTARWVVDASGRRAFIARRKRLHHKFQEHPTAALWARFEGVADLDAPGVLSAESLHPMERRLATNHFCGYGWWCWVIPLAGGQTSIGLVYHKDLFQLPGEGTLRERFEAFLRSQAGLGDLLREARVDGDDFMALQHLPYKTERYMDKGWALVGDAASFIDPYYSPGLDHVAISAYATARLLADDLGGRLEGEALDAAIAEHNACFERSYHRWYAALYEDKYELLGDADLVTCAFLVDTALYYLGVVTPIYREPEALANPVFGLANPQAKIAYGVMRTFNRRLTKLARWRRGAGVYGRRNLGRRVLIRAFRLGPGSLWPLALGLRLWLRLELERLLHPLFGRRSPASAETADAPA
jgi:flavin-dependent dehydrogenase